MDKKLRATLVAKLSVDKKFDSTYSVKNREWFVGAVLDALAATTSDSGLEAKARDIVNKANARVNPPANTGATAGREFKLRLALDAAIEMFERKDTARRVEIIYGAIAGNLALAESSQDALFEFIIRRRYRAALRMVYDVNPNENGIFVYPGECTTFVPTAARPAWRVNLDSKDLWERFTAGMVPLRVRVPANTTPDPKKAAETLWKAKNDPCDSNLFDCAHGVSCVLMDSLFEADRVDQFLKAIHARGPNHFAIIHPTLFQETHYLWEKPTEPKKVFSKEQVVPADFQVGDHVYIFNHGIYPQVIPLGFWSGEHSIVVNCGNRKFADRKGFLFSGHGLDEPETVESLHDDLIKDLQTAIHRAYSIGRIFLDYRRSNNTSIPTTKVQTLTDTTKDKNNNDVTVFWFVIDVEFKYGNYRAPKARGAKQPQASEPGFIVFEVPALNAFSISPRGVDTIGDQRSVGLEKATVIQRTGTPASGGSIYDRRLWEIPFLDPDSGTEKTFPVFGGEGGSLKLLSRQEMPKFKFGRLTATDTGALTTRPTSDASATYVSFLKSSGALPP